MAVLEDIEPKARVVGLVAGEPATVIAVERHGPDDLENVVTHLEAADGGEVTLTLEVQASSDGFDDRVERPPHPESLDSR